MRTVRLALRKTFSSADQYWPSIAKKEIGFFPEIYNEDWLFFYDDARTRQLGGPAGMRDSCSTIPLRERGGPKNRNSETC